MSGQLLSTPSNHAFSLTGLVDTIWELARETTFHAASRALAPLAEAAVVSCVSMPGSSINADSPRQRSQKSD